MIYGSNEGSTQQKRVIFLVKKKVMIRELSKRPNWAYMLHRAVLHGRKTTFFGGGETFTKEL